MQFTVVTDTSGNLQQKQIRDYDLRVIPFYYTCSGQEQACLNSDTFDGETFYRDLRNVKVTTSQINPVTYAAFFESILAQGSDVLYVAMSGGISGSCQSAMLGAETALASYPHRKIEIVDTRGASLGEGLLAIRAAKLRDKGMEVSEAAEKLRSAAERMFNVFTVDDLLFLKRGGRLSNLAAAVGTVLHIKPILKGDEEGKIVAFGKVRGRRHAIEQLAKQYEKYVLSPATQTIGIAHAACRADAEYLMQLIRSKFPPKEILLVDYEPVTGSHVGPGALALFFEAAPGVRAVNAL